MQRLTLALAALALTGSVAIAAQPEPPAAAGPQRIDLEHAHPAGHTLGVTITLPDTDRFGPGPHPAVVMISGSGPQDRDSTVVGHRPFAVLPAALLAKGVATVRFDDRATGSSTGDYAQSTTYDFAADAAELVRMAGARDDIDAERIGVLGHSEGGLCAMMLAAGDAKVPEPGADAGAVAFVALLASPGVQTRELMALQAVELIKNRVLDQEQYAKIPDLHRAYTAAIVRGAPSEEIEDAAVALARAQMGAMGVASAADSQIHQIRRSQQGVINRPWMRTFLSIDPAVWFEDIDQPTLVAAGNLDLQVVADQNVPAIAEGLEAGGNADVTVLRFDGVNHLFQPAKTGGAAEYATISKTFDDDALEQITRWIAERAGAAGAE